MDGDSIQTNNLAWQIRHLGKNASEWIQLQLSRGDNQGPEDPLPMLEFPAWLGPVLFWTIAIIGVLWVAWMIVQLLDAYLSRRLGTRVQSPEVQITQAAPDRKVGDWLRQARQFEQAGNWPAACRALYMAALQLLHDRDWVPHLASRTDGEYLQATRRLQQSRPLQILIRTHERSQFGAASLTSENLQRCRRAYEEIAK